MSADRLAQRFRHLVAGIDPDAATGWLRFGVVALPKTAPPRVSFPL